jgi:hypothetical protein
VSDVGKAMACPGICSHAYAEGTQVALLAEAEPGSRFLGWSGGGCSGTDACDLSLHTDTDVSARFARTPPRTKIAKARISANGTATFLVDAIGGGGHLECALAGAGPTLSRFKACAARRTYRHLRPGRYVFRVRSSGPGGTDPTPARREFRIRRRSGAPRSGQPRGAPR